MLLCFSGQSQRQSQYSKGASSSKEGDEALTLRLQHEARAEALARSDSLELLCACPIERKIQAYELQTALEVLQKMAPEMGLPAYAASQSHVYNATMRKAGLRDQACWAGTRRWYS